MIFRQPSDSALLCGKKLDALGRIISSRDSSSIALPAGQSERGKTGSGQGRNALPTPSFFKFYEDSKMDGGLVGPLGEDSLAASSERGPHRSWPNLGNLDDKGQEI